MPLMLPSLIQSRRRTHAAGPKAPKGRTPQAEAALARVRAAAKARGTRIPGALTNARSGVVLNGRQVAAPKLDKVNPKAKPVQLPARPAPTHRVMHRPAARMVSDIQRLPSGIPFQAAATSLTVVKGEDVVPRPVVREISAVEESRISKYRSGAPFSPYREVVEAQALPQVTIHSLQGDVLEAARPGRSAREEAMLKAARKVVERERKTQGTALLPPGLRPQGRAVAPPAAIPTALGPGTLADRIPAKPVAYLTGDSLAEVEAGAFAAAALEPVYASTEPAPSSPSLLRKVAPWALGLAALAILAR